jgi:two-component system response regulator
MDDTRPILLVEDDPMDAELARLILAECGYGRRVVTAVDGVEALDFLYQRGNHAGRVAKPVALVLLDLKLPRVDGFEVLRQTKADPVLRRISVVVLSSSAQESDIAMAYELGANAYITKGIDYENHARKLKTTARFWLEITRPAPET